eukprot:scaffold257077_cov21-Prasinocladus_malaysianus.AAC.1
MTAAGGAVGATAGAAPGGGTCCVIQAICIGCDEKIARGTVLRTYEIDVVAIRKHNSTGIPSVMTLYT